MARTCLIVKSQRKPKYPVRVHFRCNICGRSRANYRKFKICRCCFRDLALQGRIPGVRKSSW